MPLFSDDFESYVEVGSALSLSQLNPVYTGVSGDEATYGAYVSGAAGQRKVYARSGAGGEFLYRVNVDAGLDHAVEFTAGNPTSSFIGIRMVGTNAATYIGVRISTNNALQVYKVIGNAFTSLASIAGPYAAGTKIRAEVVGTTVKVYADNVLKFNAQVTDAALQTGRYVSLHARNNNALWFDDLSIDVAVAQPTAISGSVAATESNDTVQAAGRVTVKAASSITEANDTVQAAGAVDVKSTGTLTEQDDLASGQGQVSVQAVGTFLDVGDLVSSTANVRIQATLSVQEDDDQAAASSSSTVFSAVAVTEENDSLTAVGTLRITGAANLSSDDNTSANGRVRIGAAAEMLDQADGATGAGASKVYGQSSIAELDDGVQASAALSLVGFVNSQEAGEVITARGALATAAPQNIRRLVLFGRFSSPALGRGEVSRAARFSGARSTPIRLAGSV